MARFPGKKLPPHWVYVPSRREVRGLLRGLAADGMTNREMAQALFLTEKTIEVHLTSTYRKLDIRSRSQLPRALGEPRGDPPMPRRAPKTTLRK